VEAVHVRARDRGDIAGDLFDWAWAFKWTCTGVYNCDLDP